MILPGLHSELDCLRNLQEVLQKRLDLEKLYTSSLATWHSYAKETRPQQTHALSAVFLSLVEAAEKDIQSRRDMETKFQSQIEGVLVAVEELRDHSERIVICSKQLEEFDELARRALEERKRRYEEWKAWKPKTGSSTAVWLLPKQRNSPAPTESAMIAAYDRADMEVRRYVSKAEVARCSFKDKTIEWAEAISFSYRAIIDAITKCLWQFAKDQQGCASNASVGANTIVKAADDISGFRVAHAFQEALTSEAQGLSTVSIPYVDLDSRHPVGQPQPIVLGFSLPPCYFSCTTSTRFVVNVFCQLVSFVRDHKAWDNYATSRSISADHALAETFRDLERRWTGDEHLNRDLLGSHGPSMCAELVKALLASFPEPLIDWCEVPARNLRLWNPDNTQAGSSSQEDLKVLIPPVQRLYNRPQGEMLQALCDSLVPIFKEKPQMIQELISENISDLLTRKGGCIKDAFSNLRIFDSPPDPPPTTLSAPPGPSTGATDTTTVPPSSVHLPLSRRSPSLPPAVSRDSQSVTQAPSTPVQVQVQVQPTPDESPSNSPINDSTCLGWSTGDASILNDVDSLKRGIVKTSCNKANRPYTILLVGETGVGKSLVFEFIANVLSGKDVDHYNFRTLDYTNERSNFGDQSRTKSSRLYEITSNNDILVRIIDTPGLAGTCGIEQDELHKKSILTEIDNNTDSVSAVLILADGIVPRMTAETDYTFSALSAIFPKSLTNNIALMFTNVQNPQSWRFSQETDLGVLKDAPLFVLDNPIALQTRFKDDPAMRRMVKACEQRALEMLVRLFDWLDGLPPQPATEIVRLYENYQIIQAKTTKILAQIDQSVAMKEELDTLMTTLKKHSDDMAVLSNIEKSIDVPAREQQPTTPKYDKRMLVDQEMKKRCEAAKDGKEKTMALIAVNELVLYNLNQIIHRAANELAQLMEQYDGLSFLGCFVEQLGSSVRLLEQRYKDMEKIGADLQQVKKSLDATRRKLELLSNVMKGVPWE